MRPARGRAGRLRAAVLLLSALWVPRTVQAASANLRELRFAVIAEEANEPDRMLRIFSDFLAELGKRLGPKNIKVAPLVITRDITDLSQRLKQGEVDMVLESVFPTLEIQERSGQKLVPALAVVRRDQRQYHTVFFARRNGPIKTLDDLRGRTLVLQAERSTSAFAVPRAELSRHGIELIPAGRPREGRSAAFYVLAGAELNQAIWVVDGKGEAGAFNDGDWTHLPEGVRHDLVIFHETRPLLRGALSFRVGMDAEVKRASEETLLAMDKDPAGRSALASASGITRFERLTRKDVADIGEWRLSLRGAFAPR